MSRLLIGAALFAVGCTYYAVLRTEAAWFVLAAGTVLFLLALAHDERTRR